ncbi:MAG: FkbM family methyltransferase [Flavobacteriales bacterium]|nr:FkbM family methyltransferase [Flavobacteriales bacterium]
MQKCLSQDSNCVDVGSHKGEVLREMRTLAPKGKHFAFEPIPELFADLKARYNGNTTVYNFALSDEKGTTSFQHVLSKPAYSGLKLRSLDHEPTIEEIQVSTEKLDNIIPEGLNVDLIKIDVEGAELQVLQGSKNILKQHQPVVIFEHGLGASDHYGTKPEDIYQLLVEDCGMEISLLNAFLDGEHSLELESFKNQFYKGHNYYFVAHPKR